MIDKEAAGVTPKSVTRVQLVANFVTTGALVMAALSWIVQWMVSWNPFVGWVTGITVVVCGLILFVMWVEDKGLFATHETKPQTVTVYISEDIPCPFCGTNPSINLDFRLVTCRNHECPLVGLTMSKEKWCTRVSNITFKTVYEKTNANNGP